MSGRITIPTESTASQTRAAVWSEEVRFDVRPVAPVGALDVAVEVFVAEVRSPGPSILWWMEPGGGMSRRYWDLAVPVEVGEYSVARYLARRGFLVITVDHLGVGESSRPADGFSLTPQVLADVNAYVFDEVISRLHAGTLVERLEPIDDVVSIGVGHSMGASLTVHQQARHRSHGALCLLGYGGRGLIEHLTANELAYIDDPEALRRDVVALARQRHEDPLPVMPRGSSDFLVVVPIGDPVREALVEARSNLLAVAGFSTMIPGNAADAIARIDVPVLLAHGDHDIGAPLHDVGSDFIACSDLTLFRLTSSGHNHNVSPNRRALWQRMVTWAQSVSLGGRPLGTS